MTANQGKWFRQDASGQDAFPIAAPLSPPPLAGLVPAAESSDFTQMAMHVVQQLAGVRASFVTLLEVRKIINLCSVCSRMDLQDEQQVYRQGDESNFLGFILSGKFEILHGGHKLLDLLVGDMVGEIELCNPQGESSNRQHTRPCHLPRVIKSPAHTPLPLATRKSLWLSDDAASSSSEDMSTTAGWRDVMCVRRAYAYSPQRGVDSFIHLRNSFYRIWAGGSQVLIVWSLLMRRK